MNITLDFTQGNSVKNVLKDQPVAVMSATLAKKLLWMYAESLSMSSTDDIIGRHIEDLSNAKDLNHAIQLSLDFVAKRELIQNIQNDKWDAYEVKPKEEVKAAQYATQSKQSVQITS